MKQRRVKADQSLHLSLSASNLDKLQKVLEPSFTELHTCLAQDSEKLKGEVPWELEALSGQMNFFLWLGELGGHH